MTWFFSGSFATDKFITCLESKISTSDISNNPQVRTTRVFELVNSDACGPFPESLHGNKYATSFFDDFSRYALVFSMASKGDSLAKLQVSLNTVVQSCNITEFTLRSDNGGGKFYPNFKIFARITALHSNLQVLILLIKMV